MPEEIRIMHKKMSVLDIARLHLNGYGETELFIDDSGQYHLLENGRYMKRNLVDVMRRTNTALESRGMPQIDLNPNWLVPRLPADNVVPINNNQQERLANDRL